jgi:Xaa-Pro dipeptidase
MNQQRLSRVTAYINKRVEADYRFSTASVYYLTGYGWSPMSYSRAVAGRVGKAIQFGERDLRGFRYSRAAPVCIQTRQPGGCARKSIKNRKVGIDKFWFSKFLIGLMSWARI